MHEEVHLYKSLITEERAINDVVRKERLHIDGIDGIDDVDNADDSDDIPTQQMERPELPG